MVYVDWDSLESKPQEIETGNPSLAQSTEEGLHTLQDNKIFMKSLKNVAAFRKKKTEKVQFHI